MAAMVAGLGAMDVPIPHTIALVGWNWKFTAPVRPGDSIRSRWRLNRKRDVEDARWGLVTWQVEVENQHGELVALGEVVRLVARRDTAEGPEEADAGDTGDTGDAARGGRRRRRRRGGGNGGPPPEAVAGQLAAESAAAPDAVEVSPIVQPEAAELAGIAPPAESGPPSRRRRRRRGTGNGGGGGPTPAPETRSTPPGEGAWQPPQAPPGPPTQAEGPPPAPGTDPFF